MRYCAYILVLIVTWLVGIAALALGLDFEHGSVPLALLAGGYWAALCSVALAEEAAVWIAFGCQSIRGNRSGNGPKARLRHSLPARLTN